MSCLFNFKSPKEKLDCEQVYPVNPASNQRLSNNQVQDSCENLQRMNPKENFNEVIPFPLDERDIFRLKSSWRTVHRQIPETGVEFFLKYALLFFHLSVG